MTPCPARLSPRARRIALAAVLAGLSASAARAETSPYYLGASQALSHESNLYRLGDGQTFPAGTSASKSDTVSTTSLVGGIDQTFGRQRVYGGGAVRANRYQQNTNLNGETYSLDLALDWATLERLSGTLSVGSDQSLARFEVGSATGTLLKQNLQNTERLNAKVQLGVVTRYTAEAALGYRQRRYSAVEYDRLEFNETSGSLGLRFRPSNLLSLGAALRLTKASYPRFAQTGVDQFQADTLTRQDIDFSGEWQPSGRSQVTARLSPTRTRYDRDIRSDFSGITGSASWAWQPTGKLRLRSTLSHDTSQSSDAVTLGVLSQGVIDYGRTTTALRLNGDYALSAKVDVSASLALSHRNLVNSLALGGQTSEALRGSDDTSRITLGARWNPLRSTQLGCDLSSERRRSGNIRLSLPMQATTVGCTGQFLLQGF